MNILLTGSEGFIGKHLHNSLRDLHNVIGLDKKLNQDILNTDLPDEVDLVIHLAGSSGVRHSLDSPNARDDMLIPMIERNAVQYINVNHHRDFIHVYDIVCAIKTIMKSSITGVVDVGTGFSINLNDLMTSLGMNVEKKIGKHYERLDNLASINILKELGWNPKYKLLEYLRKEND